MALGQKHADPKIINSALAAGRSAVTAWHSLFSPMRRALLRAAEKDRPRVARGGVHGTLRRADGTTAAVR